MNRFEAYAESYVWDKKFEEVLTRDEAIELMNDMASNLERQWRMTELNNKEK